MMKILFCAIVGRPNVGKSSLLNSIFGQDIAIVSSRPQATREDLTGIYTEDNYQIIFTDTPGIHKPISKFGKQLNAISYNSLKEIDVVLFLSPAHEKIGVQDLEIIRALPQKALKIAIISKIDLENATEILQAKADQLKSHGFNHVYAVSIKDPQSIRQLVEELKKFTYEGEQQFDKDYVADISERFLAKETIRQHAIENLHDELPHNLAIEIDSFEEKNFPNSTKRKVIIHALIYVNKESQKGIVIGRQGNLIKKIGIAARKDLIQKLDCPVNLFLKVKVKKNWVNDEKEFKKLSY